ncbi:ArsR/SmtB family transcription factor [Legionella nagasakiensis]|uniref:ArsR/SmtB family transcription factor n=1 Tax=Legionella nagasakiensis TaxID=535290 RepID=UPI001056837B|nr:metalloregulator ArsR/SmtB family transcription factor [Legionella nagasakiensis]
MPARILISEKMAEFLGAISHPHRIRIIEELHAGEQDVNGLQSILGTSHSAVSQHLSILRAHKVVKQRKEGNRVFYRLTQPELADWLLHGLAYIEGGLQSEEVIRSAVDEVLTIWNHMPKNLKKADEGSA